MKSSGGSRCLALRLIHDSSFAAQCRVPGWKDSGYRFESTGSAHWNLRGNVGALPSLPRRQS